MAARKRGIIYLVSFFAKFVQSYTRRRHHFYTYKPAYAFLTVIIMCSPIYLVKSREDVVSKLDLSNGSGTSHSYTNTESHNPLLTKGSVEDSVLT